jgi:hypothetical protein
MDDATLILPTPSDEGEEGSPNPNNFRRTELDAVSTRSDSDRSSFIPSEYLRETGMLAQPKPVHPHISRAQAASEESNSHVSRLDLERSQARAESRPTRADGEIAEIEDDSRPPATVYKDSMYRSSSSPRIYTGGVIEPDYDEILDGMQHSTPHITRQ